MGDTCINCEDGIELEPFCDGQHWVHCRDRNPLCANGSGNTATPHPDSPLARAGGY